MTGRRLPHKNEAGSADLDEQRLRTIYTRMRRTVLRLLGYREDTEDIVQAAMEGFLKSRAAFRGEGSLEGYADAIAANVARTWMRRHRRNVLMREIVQEREEWPDLGEGPEEEPVKDISEQVKVWTPDPEGDGVREWKPGEDDEEEE